MRKLSYLKMLNDTGATRLSLVRDISTGEYFIEKHITVKIKFQQELFENEISIHSKLKNRYIVEFIERIDENRYLMEYAPYGSLNMKFPENRKKKIEWCIQFLKGLAYVHEQGLIHNDIKPSNILITRDSRAKISDFEFSGRIGEKSFNNMPDYFFPGSDNFRIHKNIKYEKNSVFNDMYSTGVVMYLLFRGGENPGNIDTELIAERDLKLLIDSCLYSSDTDAGFISKELKKLISICSLS